MVKDKAEAVEMYYKKWSRINEKIDEKDREFLNKLKGDLFNISDILYDNTRILEGSYSADKARKTADELREWYSLWPILEGRKKDK